MLKRFTSISLMLLLFTFIPGCGGGDIGKTAVSSSPVPTLLTTQTPQNQPTSAALPALSNNYTAPAKNTIGLSKADFQRIDGSTATIPLSEGIASELLGIMPEEANTIVRHYTTHYAYERLIKNKVDIIFVTEPSAEELQMAKNEKVELEVIPVVKDAFIFLVNKKNSIESLAVKQIQDIYSGKLTNWSQVGGKDAKIFAYQRPVNSGSQTLMLSLVMRGIPMVTPEKHMEPAGMGELIEVIAGYDNSENALGYSVYYYANTMYIRDTVKLIGVEGVKPQPDTIKSGKYPLGTAYYAVLRKNEPENSMARKLLKWVLSDEGQKTAEKAGYIGLR